MTKIVLVFLLISFLCLSGCTADPYFNTEYKCIDGVTYMRWDKAWVESAIHRRQKCVEFSK